MQDDALAMGKLEDTDRFSSWRERKGFEDKWQVADTVGNGMYRLEPGTKVNV